MLRTQTYHALPPELPGATPPPPQPTWSTRHTLALLLIGLSLALLSVFPLSSLNLWLAVVLLVALAGIIAGQGATGVWHGLLVDPRQAITIPIVRLQMLLWTLVILSGFLTAALVNIRAGQVEPLRINVPPELWLLMGISTTSLVGTPLLARNRQPTAPAEAQPQHFSGSDLFTSVNGDRQPQLDLNKLQMFFFTLILVLAYAAALTALFSQAASRIDALPVLDPGMLLLLGISHAGYLTNKALPANGSNGQRPEPPAAA